jgi:hypothetical protein
MHPKDKWWPGLLLGSTIWLASHTIFVLVLVFPIFIAFAKLRCKALVKEAASRKRPSTHIDNVALLIISLIYHFR